MLEVFDCYSFLYPESKSLGIFSTIDHAKGEAVWGYVRPQGISLTGDEAGVKSGCQFGTLLSESLGSLGPMEAATKRRLGSDCWVYLDPQMSESGEKLVEHYTPMLADLRLIKDPSKDAT